MTTEKNSNVHEITIGIFKNYSTYSTNISFLENVEQIALSTIPLLYFLNTLFLFEDKNSVLRKICIQYSLALGHTTYC